MPVLAGVLIGAGVTREGSGVETGFEGQRLDNQLVAAFRVESGDAGDQIVNGLQRFGRGRHGTRCLVLASPSQRVSWPTSTESDMRRITPCGIRVCFTTRLV